MAAGFSTKVELFHLKLRSRIDFRTTACRIDVHKKNGGRDVLLTGYTHYRHTDHYVKTVATEVFGEGKVENQLRVLEKLSPRFARVTQAVAPIWRSPDNSDPELLDSQAVYGSVVRTYFKSGDFTFVQHADGYVGYVPTNLLAPVSVEVYRQWKNERRAITLRPVKAGDLVIPAGAWLPVVDKQLLLADGSLLKMRAQDVVQSDPSQSKFATTIQSRAEIYLDTPYLWGGKSEVGIDCSGFVQTLAYQHGIFLPRDASMQCHVGEMVGYLPQYADLLPGDIMFFMNKNAYVFHVGIYLGDHTYMHSAGKTGPTISSVFPKGQNYMGRYGTAFVYARRIHR